jgi:hypothetical protein
MPLPEGKETAAGGARPKPFAGIMRISHTFQGSVAAVFTLATGRKWKVQAILPNSATKNILDFNRF